MYIYLFPFSDGKQIFGMDPSAFWRAQQTKMRNVFQHGDRRENAMVGISIREAARPSPEGERNAGIRLECWERAVEELWEALVLMRLKGGENSLTGNLWHWGIHNILFWNTLDLKSEPESRQHPIPMNLLQDGHTLQLDPGDIFFLPLKTL